MKKYIFLALFSLWFTGYSQTTFFSEDFESIPLSFTSTSNSSTSWGLSTNLAYNGLKSDTCRIADGDTVYLTSNSFSTVGRI